MRIGVIVGRFQVLSLTVGHSTLIDHALAHNDACLVLIGESPVRTSRRYPLPYEARKEMIATHYKDSKLSFDSIKDLGNIEKWSRQLDNIITQHVTRLNANAANVTLYGGRDSFIALGQYVGQFETEIINMPCDVEAEEHSGTALRHTVGESLIDSEDWRKGVIWATQNQYPHVYAVVDVAILNRERTHVVLGRKPNQDELRFPGGFLDPSDQSAEDAARREAFEETGLEVDKLTYICSMRIDDWRYRSEVDKLTTSFYMTEIDGTNIPIAGDDLETVAWYKITPALIHMLRSEHRRLYAVLLRSLESN